VKWYAQSTKATFITKREEGGISRTRLRKYLEANLVVDSSSSYRLRIGESSPFGHMQLRLGVCMTLHIHIIAHTASALSAGTPTEPDNEGSRSIAKPRSTMHYACTILTAFRIEHLTPWAAPCLKRTLLRGERTYDDCFVHRKSLACFPEPISGGSSRSSANEHFTDG